MRSTEERSAQRGGQRGDQRSGHRGRGAGWVVPILGLLAIAAGPVPRAAADPVDPVPIYGSSFGAVPFHVSIDDITFVGRVTVPPRGRGRVLFNQNGGSGMGQLAGEFTIVNCDTGTLFTGHLGPCAPIDDIFVFPRVTGPPLGRGRVLVSQNLGSETVQIPGEFTIVNCDTGTLFTGVPCGSTGGPREIVPEPATGLLLAAGLAACALPGARRRARLQSSSARDSR